MCPDGVQLQLDQHLPHLVPAPAGLELPIIAGCGCLLSLPVGMALFLAFWVPERLLQVMECFSSCLPCCPLAPRWSFSDQNADGSALTKCDAKGRARLQNRLLVSAVRDSGFLECPLFLTNPCCSAPNVQVSSFFPGLETPPPGAAVIPDLPRLRRWTCPDPWKGVRELYFIIRR